MFNVTIITEVLSDGSKVYDVELVDVDQSIFLRFHATDLKAAYRLREDLILTLRQNTTHSAT